jgi:hypothetical protein
MSTVEASLGLAADEFNCFTTNVGFAWHHMHVTRTQGIIGAFTFVLTAFSKSPDVCRDVGSA